MDNVVRIACVYALLGISPVFAADYIRDHVPGAKLVGQGRAHVLLWDVYDAKLYAPDGVYTVTKPFALELRYLQELEGRKIADHAIEEMRRLGYRNEMKLAGWHDRMSHIFPDVVPGAMITGIYIPEGPTIFYEGVNQIGSIDDSNFGREFFRIWLDEPTSKPGLRQSLLNMGRDRKGYQNEDPANYNGYGSGHAS